MGLFARFRAQHLHRRFIGMQHIMRQHRLMQGIDQRLQMNPADTHPVSQGGSG